MTRPADCKPSSSPSATQGRRFDETFKLDAVQLREQTDRPRAQVARDLGVSQVTPAAWEARYGSGGAGAGAGAGAGTRRAAASPGAGSAGTVAALAEVARLRAELEHMTRQRDILKKAMAIVSQEQRSASK